MAVCNHIGAFVMLRAYDRDRWGKFGVWIEASPGHKVEVAVGDRVNCITRQGNIVQIEVQEIIHEGIHRPTGRPYKVLATTGVKYYPPGHACWDNDGREHSSITRRQDMRQRKIAKEAAEQATHEGETK